MSETREAVKAQLESMADPYSGFSQNAAIGVAMNALREIRTLEEKLNESLDIVDVMNAILRDALTPPLILESDNAQHVAAWFATIIRRAIAKASRRKPE